jgi:putative MATE family efflux protein
MDTKTKQLPSGPQTKGVKTLLGDPKRAIIRLSIPMIIAMSVQTIYNFVDAVWVAGLGTDALAAIGFFFPFFFLILALGAGLGVGGGSAISRMIGRNNKKGADSVAVHTVIIMLIIGAVITLPFLWFSRDIFALLGAGTALDMTTIYAQILFSGTLIIFFTHIANSILRAEGDAKRAMYAMVLGAVLNIVLDPIFIYVLNMGIAGAAWATLLSMGVTSIILFKWLFLCNDTDACKKTYVSFTFRGFRFNGKIVRDIFKVGLPASVMQMSMSFSMIVLNLILVAISGTFGVAVLSTGWRVATLSILPLVGIATAIVSVTGAAFGSKEYKKMDTAFMYAVKIGLLIEVVIAAVTFIIAPQITALFAYSQASAIIVDDMIIFLRIMSLFYPAMVLGMFSSSMFQGTGKGTNALAITVLRSLIFTPLLAWLLPFAFGMGMQGVWWGIVIGNLIAVVVAFVWARVYIRGLIKRETP